MTTYNITGNDTLTLYDRIFVDFADGDNSTITFPDDLVTMTTGKNRNTIYSKNEAGNNAEVILRIQMGSDDDAFLLSKLNEISNDFPSVVLAEGEFVKRLGDGSGNVRRNVYTLKGGTFTRNVDVKENVAGDTEQGISIYTMKFASAERALT